MMPTSSPGLIADSGGLLEPGRMEGFTRPVLLLAGSDSAPIYRAVCRALGRRLGRAEVQVEPGAGHMLPITHAAGVAARIDGWLARHGLAAARVAPAAGG
jgi:lipase